MLKGQTRAHTAAVSFQSTSYRFIQADRLTQKITGNNALPLVHLKPDCPWKKEILDKVNDLLLLDPEETDSREHLWPLCSRRLISQRCCASPDGY